MNGRQGPGGPYCCSSYVPCGGRVGDVVEEGSTCDKHDADVECNRFHIFRLALATAPKPRFRVLTKRMPMNHPCSKHGPNKQRHVLPRVTADNRQVHHAGLAVSHKQAQHPCICFSSAASCLSVGGLQQCACAVHKAPWKSAAVLCCQHTAGFCQVQGLEASQPAEHCCKLTDSCVHTAAVKHEPANSAAQNVSSSGKTAASR